MAALGAVGLVAGAVPNLKPDHVTVLDETGKMLAAGAEDAGGLAGEMAADRKAEVEERIRKAIRDVVEGVVGPGKARVQVTAEVDQTRVTEKWTSPSEYIGAISGRLRDLFLKFRLNPLKPVVDAALGVWEPAMKLLDQAA